MRYPLTLPATALCAGLAAATACLAQPVQLELRLVPQTGTLPGPIDDGLIGFPVIMDDSGEGRTRRFELQYRVRDLNPLDGIVPSGLAGAVLDISVVSEASLGVTTLQRAEVSRYEVQLAGEVPPPSIDNSGRQTLFPIQLTGLHRPFRGFLPDPFTAERGAANGTFSGDRISDITLLSLTHTGQGDVSRGQSNDSWYGLYSFQIEVPVEVGGTLTITATARPDPTTGNTFAYWRTGDPIPRTLAQAATGSTEIRARASVVACCDHGHSCSITDSRAACIAAGGTVLTGTVCLPNICCENSGVTLMPPAGSPTGFGGAIAVDDQFAAIGASGGASDPAAPGRIHIFRDLGRPTQSSVMLQPATPQPGDSFGFAIAISRQVFGSYVVASAPNHDLPGATDAGAVSIFRGFFGAGSTDRVTISSPFRIPSAQFGHSVAAEGNWLVVGAPYERATPTGPATGAAYVFHFEAGSWIFKARLRSSDRAHTDDFGWSVAISGSTIAVGARRWDDPSANDSGSVYVFDGIGPDWPPAPELTESVKINNPTPGFIDTFGECVALSGDHLLVGAPRDASGAAFFYRRTAGEWSAPQRVVPADNSSGDWFAVSAAIDDDTAIIGARLNDASLSNQGSAYVYRRFGDRWVESATLLAPDGDATVGAQFGFAVSMHQQRVAVGAPLGGPVGATGPAGRAYAFDVRFPDPIIVSTPANVVGPAGLPTSLIWQISSDSDVTTELRRDGAVIYTGAHPAGEHIVDGVEYGPLTAAYNGTYRLTVTNACGQSTSRSVRVLTVSLADFNESGSVTVQDVFDFLAAYFGNDPRADFNGSGTVTVQDIFDFLTTYFAS